MEKLVQRARAVPPSDGEIAYLATTLGRSGAVLPSWGQRTTADVASTGGPTSLSTLLGPLYLRALGHWVPKLGVPGRPAGGIDVLTQLPGYRVVLGENEVRAVLEECGYVHFLAREVYAPLDATLFRYRQKTGAQAIPELTIASLLAKKIAVNLQTVCLDVRVAPHGNLGPTRHLARTHARRFTNVAHTLGLRATCFLTNALDPYQPYIGRSEALVALHELFHETPSKALEHHAHLCCIMACSTSPHITREPVDLWNSAQEYFYLNLTAQGSDRSAFEQRVHDTRMAHRFEHIAKRAGILSLDLGSLRSLITRHQGEGRSSIGQFPDGMGLILEKMPGQSIRPGDLLATVRVSESSWASINEELTEVISVSDARVQPWSYERV